MSNARGSVKLRPCNSSLKNVFVVFPMKLMELGWYVPSGCTENHEKHSEGLKNHKLQIRN